MRFSQAILHLRVVPLLFGLIRVVGAQSYAPNEVLVKPRPPATIQSVLQNEDIDRIVPVGGAGWYLVHSPTEDTPTLVSRLSANPDVAGVEPNWVVTLPDGSPHDAPAHGAPALSAPALGALALALGCMACRLAGRRPRPS